MLSPPPDLVVTSLEVNTPVRTGETLLVRYVVTNEGAGATFETYWRDFIVSVSLHYKNKSVDSVLL